MDRIYIIGRNRIPKTLVLDSPQKVSLTFVALPGVRANVDMTIEIACKGCDVDITGVYVCSGEDSLNIRINVRHLVGGSNSYQLYKGIVGDSAKVKFDGLVYVARDAQNTVTHQYSHSILLSPNAVAESQPQLEIYADNVECSHGSTSGFLSEEERFYMRSRGIPEQEALDLQKIAFISQVANGLPDEVFEELFSSL